MRDGKVGHHWAFAYDRRIAHPAHLFIVAVNPHTLEKIDKTILLSQPIHLVKLLLCHT